MTELQIFECDYCQKRFDDETQCQVHELEHEYKEYLNPDSIILRDDEGHIISWTDKNFNWYNLFAFYIAGNDQLKFIEELAHIFGYETPFDNANCELVDAHYFWDDIKCKWYCLEKEKRDLQKKAQQYNLPWD